MKDYKELDFTINLPQQSQQFVTDFVDYKSKIEKSLKEAEKYLSHAAEI